MCSLDLSSISPAPLSSQHRGCGAAAHAVTHGDPLSRVLERPRVDDGFGGELTFSEYAALTRLLQWPADMMEDCWCDIVNGIASATIVDVQRAAHYIEAYHNSRKTDKPIEHASGMTEEEAVMPTPTVVVEASPCISTIDVVEVSSCSSMDSTEVGMKKQLVRPTSAPAFPRYALDTFASSIRKVDRPTSASTKMPTAGREADGGVFLRLHAHAKGWNERRAHAVAAAAAAMEDVEAPQTHRPTRTSSSRAAKASKPSTAHYQAPTESYYARLENRRATYDAIEDAPETPRVAFQPAPGPSAEVPNGYVEAVARLRKYVHARHHLREGGDDSRPILRLPLPQRGESLDIRLGADPMARRRGQERKAISVAALVQRMAEPGCEEHTRYT